MKTLLTKNISSLLLILTLSLSNAFAAPEGGDHGGGGFLDANSKYLLTASKTELANSLRRASPQVFSNLPAGLPAKLADIIANVQIPATPSNNPNDEPRDFNYVSAGANSYIYVTKNFITEYAGQPVAAYKRDKNYPGLRVLQDNIKIALLHEVAHILGDLTNGQMQNIGRVDDKTAETFAMRAMNALDGDDLVCKGTPRASASSSNGYGFNIATSLFVNLPSGYNFMVEGAGDTATGRGIDVAQDKDFAGVVIGDWDTLDALGHTGGANASKILGDDFRDLKTQIKLPDNYNGVCLPARVGFTTQGTRSFQDSSAIANSSLTITCHGTAGWPSSPVQGVMLNLNSTDPNYYTVVGTASTAVEATFSLNIDLQTLSGASNLSGTDTYDGTYNDGSPLHKAMSYTSVADYACRHFTTSVQISDLK